MVTTWTADCNIENAVLSYHCKDYFRANLFLKQWFTQRIKSREGRCWISVRLIPQLPSLQLMGPLWAPNWHTPLASGWGFPSGMVASRWRRMGRGEGGSHNFPHSIRGTLVNKQPAHPSVLALLKPGWRLVITYIYTRKCPVLQMVSSLNFLFQLHIRQGIEISQAKF